MRIYLVRHGEAAASEDNPSRSLTRKGREDSEKIAELLARLGTRVRAVEHSGKLRAQQTAEIIAARLRVDEGVVQADGLMPNDEVNPWARELNRAESDVMLVGHLPFVSRLAARLLTGGEERSLLKFVPSSVLCLEQDIEGDWRVSYFITPDQL
jgi:phosphohistidine phosphatase